MKHFVFRAIILLGISFSLIGCSQAETQSNNADKIETARRALLEVGSSPPPVLFATLGERAAELGLLNQAVQFGDEAISMAQSSTDFFYVCLRAARIQLYIDEDTDQLHRCLDSADEYVQQIDTGSVEDPLWPYLHLELASELGQLGYVDEQRRLVQFAAESVWLHFDEQQRAVYGRFFVPPLAEVMGAEYAANYCRQTAGAAFLERGDPLDIVFPLLIVEFNCFESLPTVMRVGLDRSLSSTLIGIAAQDRDTEALQIFFLAASYQAFNALDYPYDWGRLYPLDHRSECVSSDLPSCILGYVLENFGGETIGARDLGWVTHLFSLAVVAGTPDQIHEIESWMRLSHGTSEMLAETNIAANFAYFGNVPEAIARLHTLLANNASSRSDILPTIVDVAMYLNEQQNSGAAVQLLEILLPNSDQVTATQDLTIFPADWIRAAIIYRDAGRPDHALSLLTVAERITQSPDVLLRIAQFKMALGAEESAAGTFDRAVELAMNPGSATDSNTMSSALAQAIAAASRVPPKVLASEELSNFPWGGTHTLLIDPALIPY